MAIDQQVLAQLAAAAYRNASDFNRIVAPVGWTEIAKYPASGPSDDPDSGFSAAAYRGPGGDIVIAYAGTNVDSRLDNDWLKANAPAALGGYSPQVTHAAEFYWQILNRPDVGLASKGRVSFTGHSLGGGLASLMSVYFDLPATTFDSAPFELSAFVGSALDQYAKKFAAAGITDPSWQQYRSAQSSSDLPQVFAARETKVSHVFVTNEALAALRFQYSAIIGSDRALDSGSASAHASGRQLHSMLLAWAMLSNSDFAEEVRKLPRLFALIDDGQLFSRDRTFEEQDFFSLLLKFEQGTAMLAQFTGDVKDISDMFAASSATVSDALIALTIAHYYRMSNGFDPHVGEAVKKIAGGLELSIGGAGWNGRGFVHAYELLREMVYLLSGGGADIARGWAKERLIVSDGAALGFSDTAGSHDLVLGGTAGDAISLAAGDDYASGLGGADNLDGGPGDDVLDGGADGDTLDGGPGDDTLIGGTGTDVYRFTGSWGHDTIEDGGGDGRIEMGGAPLPTGLKVVGRDNLWVSADGAFIYVFSPAIPGGGSGTLYALQSGGANTITINGYVLGQLGVTLSDDPATFAAPDTQLIAPAGTTPYELVGDPNGVASRDELVGSGGVDLLHGLLGDDRLEGGDNGDILLGGLGSDRILSGAGNDAIHGGGHMPGVTRGIEEPPADKSFVWLNDGPGWYAGLTTQGTLSVGGALWGYTAATGGANDADAGDLIDAGSGHDWVYGDAGADVIDLGVGDDIANGGQGADIIIGGDGVDLIMGDYIETGGYLFLVSEHGADVLVGDAGDDVIEGDGGDDRIYGGADNDTLWGDDTYGLPASYHGNDLLDGAGGNDRLTGQGGGDELHGGGGDDLLVGDDTAARLAGEFHGADYLDGGDGNDELQGQGGADVLLGGGAADALFGDDLTARLAGGFHGDDYLDGEDGDDYLEGQGGADRLFGGGGADTMYGDAVAGNVDPAFHGDDYLDGGADADLLFGGGGRDILFGGSGNDQLQGDDIEANLPSASHGDDYLDGEDGDDVLAGQGGADTLYGGDGADALMGDAIASQLAASANGNDLLDGGAGPDELIGGGGDDVLYGGEDNDALNGDDSVQNLEAAAHGNDRLHGDAGDDALVGAGGDDFLSGGTGSDTLRGDGSGVDALAYGADVLDGGDGVDLLIGEGGADELLGGTGDDQLWGDASLTLAIADAAHGNDVLDGGDNSDVLVGGGGADTLYGGAGHDLLYGDGTWMMEVLINGQWQWRELIVGDAYQLADALYGGDGSDRMVGGGGDDSLDGGDGDDQLSGSTGNDLLIGGPGNDILEGGDGNDRYAWGSGGGQDLVLDQSTPPGSPAGSSDALDIEPGIDPVTVVVIRDDTTLCLYRPYSTDQVHIRNYFDEGGASTAGTGHIETIRFSNGQQWILPDVVALLQAGGNQGNSPGGYYIATAQGEGGGLNFSHTTLPASLFGAGGNDNLVGGGGNDWITGAAGADYLAGGDGNDVLEGGAGNDDAMLGGRGSDTFVFRSGDGHDIILGYGEPAPTPGDIDTLRFGPAIRQADVTLTRSGTDLRVWVEDGTDSVRIEYQYDDVAPSKIERFEFADGTVWDLAGIESHVVAASRFDDFFIGTATADVYDGMEGNDAMDGADGDDALSGGPGNDELSGGFGNDLLDGGPGVDLMDGGNGNDTFVVDDPGDVVRDSYGIDTVRSMIDYSLAGSAIENLVLIGAAATSATGNDFNNILTGNASANVLAGGLGNDTYVLQNADDMVIEVAGQGTDTVQAGVGISLPANVENLTLTGTDPIDGTGNASNNTIQGNAAANVLDGSAGNDTLRGGAGNDIYVVDSASDVVTESANEGVDTVRSSVSFTLGNNVENVTLTGSTAINATGNSLNNVLIGNGANNTLSGGAGNDLLDGGAGADTMRGGTGDDTFVVGASTDVVTENAGEGADTVHSSVTLTLAANVEHLLLSGTMPINGTGNSLANHVRGNGAANTLSGAGGNDVLQGAGGNDTLNDTSGNNLLDAGDGADSLSGGTGREFVAGGAGSDTLKLGGGADIIAFNRGGGADSVTAPTSGAGLGETNDTLTLGGVRYAELRLARSGSDLLVKVAGTADSLRFTGWYSAPGNRTVTTLQLIVDSTADYSPVATDPLVNRRVVRLNFGSLVNAFNSAYAANPAIGDWAVPAGTLSAAFLAGSDTQAIGGALAYHYGRASGFGALDFAAAAAVLGDANFATTAQAFNASPTTGGFRLLGAGDVDLTKRSAAASDGGGPTLEDADAADGGEAAVVRAAGSTDDRARAAVPYLTAESWLLAAEATFDDVPPDRLAPSVDGVPAVGAARFGGGTATGSAEFEAAMSTASRWRMVDAAMFGLAPGAAALPGGEAAAESRGLDDWLGWHVAAIGGGSSAGRARGQVAAC